jgi:predicted P-loop ATPase
VLIAAVRRVREPGVKFDEMLILESEQGKAKSTAIRTLCPDSDWFSDGLPLGADAQKVVEQTTGKWIIEASELHGNRGKEVEALKAFMSRSVDGPVRMAYHRLATQRPRQFILIGTTNSVTGYLKDSTGGRRFWPVRIQEFDIKTLAKTRDQLWAEAAAREATGESIRLEEHLWDLAAQEQEKRRLVDDWEDVIGELVESIEWVPSLTIWGTLGLRTNQQSIAHINRLSEVMQKLGFSQKTRLSVIFVTDGKAAKPKQTTCWVRDGFETTGIAVRWIQEFADGYTGRPETDDETRLGGM